MGRQPCEDCVKVWQAYNKPTPCEGCKPTALEDSQPYLLLYSLCSDQLIVGANGAIGLNFLAVERIAKLAGVEEVELLDFYENIRFINTIVLNEQYKDNKRKQKQNQRR